ncbi:MAG TPA: DUF3833 family protein [Caulobacteraceae bacterium]
MDTRTTYAGDTVFRPEVFFLGRTEGSGVVRDSFGRVVRRCEIATSGAPHSSYGAIHFDETFTYDDGEVDVWRWALTCGADGRYVAAEAVAGSGIGGQRQGDDYVFSFRRPVGRARGLTAPTFSTRLTLLAPDLALRSVRIRLFGAPVGAMTAIHRRVSG